MVEAEVVKASDVASVTAEEIADDRKVEFYHKVVDGKKVEWVRRELVQVGKNKFKNQDREATPAHRIKHPKEYAAFLAAEGKETPAQKLASAVTMARDAITKLTLDEGEEAIASDAVQDLANIADDHDGK